MSSTRFENLPLGERTLRHKVISSAYPSMIPLIIQLENPVIAPMSFRYICNRKTRLSKFVSEIRRAIRQNPPSVLVLKTRTGVVVPPEKRIGEIERIALCEDGFLYLEASVMEAFG